MKLFEEKNYPNFLDGFTLSTKEIHDRLKNIKLFFPGYRNHRAEYVIDWPSFMESLVKYIELKGTFPEQYEFPKFFISNNPDYFNSHEHTSDEMRGLECRIFRAYPSLVRDICFSQFAKEKFKDGKVLYNVELDRFEKIDMLFDYNSKKWGIALYVGTEKSIEERKRKSSRHIKFDNVEYIDMPLDFKGSVECGDFYLYGDREYNEICNKILKTDKE